MADTTSQAARHAAVVEDRPFGRSWSAVSTNDAFYELAKTLDLDIAPRRGVDSGTTLLSLDGRRAGRRIYLRRTLGLSPKLVVGALLRPHLDLGVSFTIATRKNRGLLAGLFGGADVELGHVDFDAAFDVQTDDRARLAAIVDAQTAADLVELGAGRRLSLDPWGLQVFDATIDFSPSTLAPLIDRLADLAAGIARKARHPGSSVYR